MLRVIRENLFIREFDWNGRRYIDSKYRTCELPYRAGFFIDQWLAADPLLRGDMEASLAEFPVMLRYEASRIVEFLSRTNPQRASVVASVMSRQSEPPDPDHVALYRAILIDIMARGEDAWTLVGEDRWFQVYQSIWELRVDEKEGSPECRATDEQLVVLVASLPEGLHS